MQLIAAALGGLVDDEDLEAGTGVLSVLEFGALILGEVVFTGVGHGGSAQPIDRTCDHVVGPIELAVREQVGDLLDIALTETTPVELDRLQRAQRAPHFTVFGDHREVAAADGQPFDRELQILPRIRTQPPRARRHSRIPFELRPARRRGGSDATVPAAAAQVGGLKLLRRCLVGVDSGHARASWLSVSVPTPVRCGFPAHGLSRRTVLIPLLHDHTTSQFRMGRVVGS